MPKALVIIDLPDSSEGKRLAYDAKTLIQHPNCADADSKLLKIVRVKTVAIFDTKLPVTRWDSFDERIRLLISSIDESALFKVQSRAGAV